MSVLSLILGLRLIARNLGFSIVAILTLALGIGATTSIFTVANAVLLRPLPYSNPDRLILLGTANSVFSLQRFTFLHDHSKSFAALAAFTDESFNLTERGDPEQLAAARVTVDFFRALGVRPVLGRDFLAEEDMPAGKPVVLISHSLWMRRFARNPAILGQPINLNTQPYTIIGVTPPGFQFAFLGSDVDIWAPRVFNLNLATPQQIQGGAGFLSFVGLLRAGVSKQQLQAEMDVLNQQYQRENAALPTPPRSSPSTPAICVRNSYGPRF